jgi:hypothetical protein
MGADPEIVRAVAEHQRAELLARAAALRDDHRTVSGISWGVFAIDRILRACDGETDPTRLGLPGAVVAPIQDDLFGEKA